MYQGDYLAASTVVFNFNTASFSDGSPITLAGSPAISVYKNSTTESTTGVTLTVDYDSRTGMHHVVIDTSLDGTFYAAGNDFDVIITAGTVGGTSVVGRKVGSFSLENRTQKADVRKWNGTAVSSPATAGIPDVNVKNMNNVAATSITTINANQGTTQPINFTGTSTSALAKVDVIDIVSVAATLDANNALNVSAKYWAGTAITASSIPVATAAGAAGGLFIAGSNAATTFATLTVSGATTLTGAVTATNASNSITGITVAGYASGQAPLQPTVAGRTLDVSLGGEAGLDWANIGSPTTTVGLTGTTISTGQTITSVSGAVGSVTGNVGGNVTGSVGSVVAGVTVSTNNDKTGYSLTVTPPTAAQNATAVLTTQMTESYAADGVAPTLAQAAFLIQQAVTEFAISGTTKTIKKLDGTTTAAVETLDSSTAPTSITRTA